MLKLFNKSKKNKDLLKELIHTDRMNYNEFQDYQLHKLKALIFHAYKHSIYYREAIDHSGLQVDDFSTLDDLTELPVLKRELVASDASSALIADNIDSMSIKHTVSGGTSGLPVRTIFDNKRTSILLAAARRYNLWWGREFGERTAILWGNIRPSFIRTLKRLPRKMFRFPGGVLALRTNVMTPQKFAEYYQRLYRMNPIQLEGYAGSLYRMARFMKENNLLVWSGLKLVSCKSEKVTSAKRKEMETVYKCPVTEIYSCLEIGNIAYECPEGRALHVTGEHVILEVIDDAGQPVYNSPGSILLTDLDNYAMPLIRYQIGDIGILSDKKCLCGRPHTVLKEIIGREADALRLANGRELIVGVWDTTLSKFKQIRQGCVRIIDLGRLQIDLILSEEMPQKDEKRLRELVENIVGEGIHVEFRKVDSIPDLRSGKSPSLRWAEQEVDINNEN